MKIFSNFLNIIWPMAIVFSLSSCNPNVGTFEIIVSPSQNKMAIEKISKKYQPVIWNFSQILVGPYVHNWPGDKKTMDMVVKTTLSDGTTFCSYAFIPSRPDDRDIMKISCNEALQIRKTVIYPTLPGWTPMTTDGHTIFSKLLKLKFKMSKKLEGSPNEILSSYNGQFVGDIEIKSDLSQLSVWSGYRIGTSAGAQSGGTSKDTFDIAKIDEQKTEDGSISFRLWFTAKDETKLEGAAYFIFSTPQKKLWDASSLDELIQRNAAGEVTNVWELMNITHAVTHQMRYVDLTWSAESPKELTLNIYDMLPHFTESGEIVERSDTENDSAQFTYTLE